MCSTYERFQVSSWKGATERQQWWFNRLFENTLPSGLQVFYSSAVFDMLSRCWKIQRFEHLLWSLGFLRKKIIKSSKLTSLLTSHLLMSKNHIKVKFQKLEFCIQVLILKCVAFQKKEDHATDTSCDFTIIVIWKNANTSFSEDVKGMEITLRRSKIVREHAYKVDAFKKF